MKLILISVCLQGLVEYTNKDEEATMIAMESNDLDSDDYSGTYTHREIHAIMNILGGCAPPSSLSRITVSVAGIRTNRSWASKP